MQIKQQPLLELMGAPNVRFSIPRFQRAYSWGAPQCDELWRDLMRAARAHRSHFMGTLIYLQEERDGVRELAIVDGQQRLTTLTIMLAALASHLRQTGEQLFGIDADYIHQTYLSCYCPPPTAPRSRPSCVVTSCPKTHRRMSSQTWRTSLPK